MRDRQIHILRFASAAFAAGLAMSVVSSHASITSLWGDNMALAPLEFDVAPAYGRLVAMEDDELEAVTGQSLFFSDKIVSSGVVNGIQNNFTFYRLGLDANLSFNLNIDKLQLGCGGFNEGLVANACDFDVDFLSFAGMGGPGTDFVLELPYIEIAVKNDGDRTRREVSGIKIGGATAEGIMSIGRRYTPGQINQEWGRTVPWNPALPAQNCGTSASTQDSGARLACHSGANRMSGFLLGELSANGRIADFGGADVCMGWTSQNISDPCNVAQRMYLAFSGTRMDRIGAYSRNNELITYNCGGLLAFLGCPNANFKLSESLRFLHDVRLTSNDPAPGVDGPRITRDFFLSFQRERIAYPIFNMSSPYATLGPPPNHNPAGLGANTAANCSNANRDAGVCRQGFYTHAWESRTSAFSAPANTGWWMNITYADLRDQNVGVLNLGGLFDALDALSSGGVLQDLDLGQSPVKNCFGTARFC
jgi:hypothetical protein